MKCVACSIHFIFYTLIFIMKKNIIGLLLLLSFSLSAFAQFTSASYMIEGFSLPYKVMFPANYDESKQYPLVVLLHGAGERGADNEAQLVHGKNFLVDNFQSRTPAIVLVPQCPANNYWANVERHQIGDKMTLQFGVSDKPTAAMATLTKLIQNWVSSGKVDTRRVYVGGLSMGSMGTYELLWRMPQTFSAAFSICGGADLSKLHLFAKNTPVWVFHGEADSVVSVEHSRKIYKNLQDLGCDVKYTEYPNVNHNSWDNAFAEPALVDWLFSHTK